VKVLYVTTISDTVNAFLIPHIQMLVNQGYQVDVACHVHQELDERLEKYGCNIFNIEFDRSPLKLQNVSVYKKLKKLIIEREYDIVHTHTPIASAITRVACRKMDKVKVIYTAHGFHFYKGAPLINWLMYYPVERWLSRYTDVLITINMEDYERSKKEMKSHKIEYVPGVGLDISKFRNPGVDRFVKRAELEFWNDAFVILSVGELNKNKNHETVIRAIARLNNPNVYYAICGKGPLENYLKDLSARLKIEHQVKFLGYRKDIHEIYQAADLFVFPSLREGLPVSLMEAIASGLVVVCSKIRGNVDLVVDDSIGRLIEPKDDIELSDWITYFYNNRTERNQRNHISPSSLDKYSLDNVLQELMRIYLL
jgi:Glycosyltransferase